MLWTDITKLVTRDGKTLVGTAVRDWLKARRVLPDSYTDASAVIAIDRDQGVVLRTREEVRAWLLEKHLAQEVTLGPLPVGNPQNRQGARGRGPVNRNDAPLTIAFVKASDNQVITTAALEQGKTLALKVRVTPGGPFTKKFELAFIGAKIRVREAIRSVIGSDTGYRYLSRVRVARHPNGIGSPLSAMNRAVLAKDCERRKSGRYYDVEEFTLLGLEAGVERIQACLINRDGSVACSAVLEVTVSWAATGVGAFRVFRNTTVDNFKAADPEFDKIYALAPSTSADVKVGVCDSGTYDDESGDKYLSSRWVSGKYFDSLDVANDRDTKPDVDHAHHILDYAESPSLHGTNVAGQAVWGSPKVKLVDVMVQRGQETGKVTAAAAVRAFTWARGEGVAVINCSKVMPFAVQLTNDFVKHATTESQVLFLATGGNTSFSFPLSREPKAANNEVTREFLPTHMINTLWGGGCRLDRTPHESRGHGPAIEIMVPSNDPTVYSPREVRRAFRMQKIQKFRQDMIDEMTRRDVAIVAPAPTVVGTLSVVQRQQLQRLQGAQNLSPADTLKLQQLQALQANSPNPQYWAKDAYHKAAALFDSWALNTASEAQLVTSLTTWADNFAQFLGQVAQDAAALLDAARLQNAVAFARDALLPYLRDEASKRNLQRHRDALAEITPVIANVAGEDGVSFGLPVVANVAAKLKLINRGLTPNKMKRILIDTSDIDPGFESQCIARGIVNPLRAYLAAFDDDVSTGGRLHHDYAPVKDNAILEARRVYYTFFYMDAQGLDLYNAIKGRLQASYKDLDIDLVEAEPPLQIKNEPLTYVTGRFIHGHGWSKVVPSNKVHPLVYAKRHLRLVLVNQLAHVEGNFMSGEDSEFSAAYDTNARTWAQAVQTGRVVLRTVRFISLGPRPEDSTFACNANIGGGEFAKFVFAINPQHIVTKLKVYGDADVELGVYDAPHAKLRIVRTDDRSITFNVTDQALNTLIRTQGRKVGFQFGVVQRIGGNADKCNIFVNNSYHGGPSGTPDAASSALVLFQHEIGHALGMVPPGHPQFYNKASGYGGDGNHCGTNTVVLAQAGMWAAYGVLEDGASGSVKVPVTLSDAQNHAADVPCVMYHTRSQAHHRSAFCDECKGRLRGHTLEGGWGNWSAE